MPQHSCEDLMICQVTNEVVQLVKEVRSDAPFLALSWKWNCCDQMRAWYFGTNDRPTLQHCRKVTDAMGCLISWIRGNSDEEEDDDYATLCKYDGEKNCFGQKHGTGQYYYKNGDFYDGQWRWNMKHGYGVYIFSSGKK